MSYSKLKQEHLLLTISENISEYTSYDNIKNPYNFKSWWNTISASTDAPYEARVKIFEAALHYLPASYKIWFNYLSEAREYVSSRYNPYDKRYDVINDLHERALITLHKMPRIWLDYASFLITQNKITKTRKVFDEALKALPITQHEMIWKAYIAWIKEINIPMLSKKVLMRYKKLNPDAREEFIYFMIENEQFNQAAKLILEILNDDMFHSLKKKTKYHYWLLLCEIIETYPEEVSDIDCEVVIRHGLMKYTDEIGRLWVALGNYYIKLGVFGKAREVFEEAMIKVRTVRDFTLVFNAYLTFEEEVAFKNLEGDVEENMKDNQGNTDENNEDISDLIEDAFTNLNIKCCDNSNNFISNEHNSTSSNTNYKLLRLVNLLERRPFLLNSTLLRQNPNNIKEWLKRIKLCKDYSHTISTYESAISTINPSQCVGGKLSDIYISLSSYYLSFNDISKANATFHRACHATFSNTNENVLMWCLWAEMHLQFQNYKDALLIMKTVCTSRKYSQYNKSIKLWSLYVDIVSSIGTFEETKTIYEAMLNMKIATLQTVFNYCAYLESHMYFEETFRVYEQAIDNFAWPSLYDLYIVYVSKFIERYKGEKIERVRDLFTQILASVPKNKAKIFYYMYAGFEEEYGLLNNSIQVLYNAINEVEQNEQAEIFSVLIAKTASHFGIAKTRHAFDKAMDVLSGNQAVEIGMKYANIECKLGEIDRARGICVHLSQFCDPNKSEFYKEFFTFWEKFEIKHGNVETYQEMENIKKIIASKYSLNVAVFNSKN